jgi:hypothetical protein
MDIDDIDTSVWISIGLTRVLQAVNDQIYDAIRNGHQPVEIKVGGRVVFTSAKVDDKLVITKNGENITYHHFA